MLGSHVLLAAVVFFHAATAAPAAGQTVYKLEMSGNQTVWSEDQPKDTGLLILFHRSPDGLLVSVKKSDVRRIVATRRGAVAARSPRSGNAIIDLGPTAAGSTAASGNAPAAGAAPPLGARKDGTALLNPDRQYRPDWDSKQVPGLNLPYPASPNDYMEGKTLAYPPGAAIQEAPGEPPKAPPSSGEPPKGPSL